MIFKMRLDDEADADIIQALASMPTRERSAQTKMLIRLALAGTGGLLVRIAELERRMDALGDQIPANATPATPLPPTVDAQKAAMGLFKKFGALDHD